MVFSYTENVCMLPFIIPFVIIYLWSMQFYIYINTISPQYKTCLLDSFIDNYALILFCCWHMYLNLRLQYFILWCGSFCKHNKYGSFQNMCSFLYMLRIYFSNKCRNDCKFVSSINLTGRWMRLDICKIISVYFIKIR